MGPLLNVGIISQARMTSTRLPGKILMPVKNKSLLSYQLERLQQSDFPVFIATTTNATDNPVANFCIENKIEFYRGDEQNVLSRFYECAHKFKLDVIVRVTSDCPLIDGKLIQEAVQDYLLENKQNCYASNCIERTYPRGFDFEIFSFNMLEEANNRANTESQKEHVTPYFYQNSENKFSLKHVKASDDNSKFRITVDTPEDFELIKILIEKYACDKKNAAEICSVLKLHPELSEINKHIEQKKA